MSIVAIIAIIDEFMRLLEWPNGLKPERAIQALMTARARKPEAVSLALGRLSGLAARLERSALIQRTADGSALAERRAIALEDEAKALRWAISELRPGEAVGSAARRA